MKPPSDRDPWVQYGGPGFVVGFILALLFCWIFWLTGLGLQ